MEYIQIYIGISFFFFFFDLLFIIIYKRKKGIKNNQNKMKKSPFSLYRMITIFGILAMNTFLCICCVYTFLYGFLKTILPGFSIHISFQLIGFSLTLFGDLILLISYKELGVNWAYPIDKWEKKGVLVTSGIYSRIRHPIYLSFNIISIGFILLIQDWILFGLYLLGAIGLYLQALSEEKALNEYFGKDYTNYMKKTGRFFLNVRKREVE